MSSFPLFSQHFCHFSFLWSKSFSNCPKVPAINLFAAALLSPPKPGDQTYKWQSLDKLCNFSFDFLSLKQDTQLPFKLSSFSHQWIHRIGQENSLKNWGRKQWRQPNEQRDCHLQLSRPAVPTLFIFTEILSSWSFIATPASAMPASH